MPSCTQLQLGAPLFLFALIIAHAKWHSCVHVMGFEPPKMQSIVGYTRHNCRKAAAAGRKRAAMAAVKLAALVFVDAGVVAPAGVCPDTERPGRLDKLPSWLALLAQLSPTEAVATLADNVLIVPGTVYRAVENEYNAGIRASNIPGLAQLAPGHLAHKIAGLQCTISNQTPHALPVGPSVRTAIPHGHFYYIGAGVGCGIREIQQEGYVCSGACEIDEYCQLVLQKHDPGLKVHSDVRTLDLESQVADGVLLDVVVISTPCTDVSTRGLGLAQLGQESTLFFTAVDAVKQYADITGHLPTIISENVQGRRFRHWDANKERWMQPFLKVEADALLAAGYQDLAWREVSSEAFGVPNPKNHIILMATATQSALVDSCLFSTGLVPCAGCADGCYQCGERALQPGANAALAWDMGTIYGLANPARLPAPTTSSLARTVIIWPESGWFAKLHIEDAERSQGMFPGHTALPPTLTSPRLTPAQVLKERFKCVGNGLHGQVLGELFHRMPRIREYPSRLMTADCVPLPDCMQPGVLRLQEPTAAFPRAGLYKALHPCDQSDKDANVQKPQATLGRWLRTSTQSVAVRGMQCLMKRLETHEPQQHEQAASLLSSGTMPNLLYSANLDSVNPAILCCMLASRTTSSDKRVYLSVPPDNALQPACSMPRPASSTPIVQEIRTVQTETSMQEIGEVWWLFDAEQPYIAEVFKNGNVPGSRLPHMDRSMVRGRHVARVLGCTRQHLKLVNKKAAMCLFTPWTSSVSDLTLQASIRKRSRASSSEAATNRDDFQQCKQEAAALHWLRTGEEAATAGLLTAGVERVREMLRLEAAGMSDCGFCSSCAEGSGCIRAANRRAAQEGKQGARWAEEAGRLIGRQFELDHKGQRVQAEVTRYDGRSARHEVEWHQDTRKRSVIGSNPGSKAWVDFCRDLVYRETHRV